MSGGFPEGIFNLPYLQAIDFSQGALRGPLPTKLGKTKQIYSLRLGQNMFTGEKLETLA